VIAFAHQEDVVELLQWGLQILTLGSHLHRRQDTRPCVNPGRAVLTTSDSLSAWVDGEALQQRARTTSERLDAEVSQRTEEAMLALEPVFQQLIRLQLRHPELVPDIGAFIDWLPAHREEG
jgi:hypothetical protein